MAILDDSPTNVAVAVLLALAAGGLAVRSARLVVSGLREASCLDVVRAIRVFVLALVAAIFAVGVASRTTGFLVMGSLILAEELYETALLVAVIRGSERA